MGKARRSQAAPKYLVCIADTHFGCRFAPCPDRVPLTDDSAYLPSPWQRQLNDWWMHWWDAYVPSVVCDKPFWLLHCGDIIEGRHHRNTVAISLNLDVQAEVALAMLEPVVRRKQCRGLYVIRGTEAHDGPAHETCNMVAKQLGAIRANNGEWVWSEVDMLLGPHVIHAMHHSGISVSPVTEGGVLLRNLLQQNFERMRWGNPPITAIVRGHAHYAQHREFAGGLHAVSLPAWQLKTHHASKVVPDKAPQVGGAILEDADGELRVHQWVRSLKRRKPQILT